MNPKLKINHQIRAKELRVITETGENLGVLSLSQALAKATELGLDLIEISPVAVPPIAKIIDFGKFQYQQNKKQKEARSHSHSTETKSLQVKIGTSEHDLELKAKNASKWLKEGNRVKIGLFLAGRSKYSDMEFKKERLNRILSLISEEYKIADGPSPGPKGLVITLERASKK
ncbi:MAG: translation initiation factor IF-3 [Candidatus Yonathbacteria bacterium]|nr:translation initiation factor IF-3 [Candidatus Yonathbacteria bacterium]